MDVEERLDPEDLEAEENELEALLTETESFYHSEEPDESDPVSGPIEDMDVQSEDGGRGEETPYRSLGDDHSDAGRLDVADGAEDHAENDAEKQDVGDGDDEPVRTASLHTAQTAF